MGLDLGMTRAEAEALNGPAQRSGPANPGYTAARWEQPGGNALSITQDASGRIVYMETFWGRAMPSQGQGVRFGATTRDAFLAAVGSAGMAFPGRGPEVAFGGGTGYFHTYEIVANPGRVMTFVFMSRVGQSSETAPLDSIILSEISYQSEIWGGVPYPLDEAYRPLDIDF
jgi:hypothetical protein